MELRQLRSLVTLVDTGFSVSRAAEGLHLVQSAVSQHLKQLEGELGVQLFVRQGKRLGGLTEVGAQVVHYARRALADAGSILAVGRDHVAEERGVLRLGTTHTQACYVLPPVIRRFSAAYPAVEIEMEQGTPSRLAELAAQGTVDFAICTEALGEHAGLRAIPCHRWNRCLIAPRGHPLLERSPLTLGALSEHPLITYVLGFTGRRRFSNSFARVGLQPRVVLSAADTDVIKTYVREGLGLGIIADLAYQPGKDEDLGARDLSHLFPWETTRIAYARDKYLRRFQQRFIEIFQEEAPRRGACEGKPAMDLAP